MSNRLLVLPRIELELPLWELLFFVWPRFFLLLPLLYRATTITSMADEQTRLLSPWTRQRADKFRERFDACHQAVKSTTKGSKLAAKRVNTAARTVTVKTMRWVLEKMRAAQRGFRKLYERVYNWPRRRKDLLNAAATTISVSPDVDSLLPEPSRAVTPRHAQPATSLLLGGPQAYHASVQVTVDGPLPLASTHDLAPALRVAPHIESETMGDEEAALLVLLALLLGITWLLGFMCGRRRRSFIIQPLAAPAPIRPPHLQAPLVAAPAERTWHNFISQPLAALAAFIRPPPKYPQLQLIQTPAEGQTEAPRVEGTWAKILPEVLDGAVAQLLDKVPASQLRVLLEDGIDDVDPSLFLDPSTHGAVRAFPLIGLQKVLSALSTRPSKEEGSETLTDGEVALLRVKMESWRLRRPRLERRESTVGAGGEPEEPK
ncbi:hypothetical protein C8J57DRAFT_1218861 [Mycena rebaudengoi]|nr:hypothetical protein C8J57DRAFT_1218861 [Mycena rebaudengoi]